MINNISLNFSILEETPNIPLKKVLSQFEKFPSRRRETKQLHGFNTSPDKDKSNLNFYVMTDYKNGSEVIEMPDGTKKRRPKYTMLFNSMDGAFQLAKVQRQVFTGLNHTRRDILVVDIDASYPACFSTGEMLQRKNTISNLCNSLNIMPPNYIEFHKDSGHCQIGWYLTEFFVNYKEDKYLASVYRFICKAMAKLMNADECFTGGNIKNPYHDNNIAFFFDKAPRDTIKLIKQIYNAAILQDIEVDIPKKEIENKKKKKKEVEIEYIPDEEFKNSILDNNPLKYLGAQSRNCYGFGYTRTWVYRYMREHGGNLPSKEVTLSVFKEYEYKSLNYLGKETIEPDNNINASVTAILRFCKDQYDPEVAEAIKASHLSPKIREERRQSSILTRQAKKALRVLKAFILFSKGYTQKRIAIELGCTQPTVHNLLSQKVGDAIEEIKSYLKFHKKVTNKKTRILIDQLWEELYEWGITEEDIFNVLDKLQIPFRTINDITTAELSINKGKIIENKTRGDPYTRYIISV